MVYGAQSNIITQACVMFELEQDAEFSIISNEGLGLMHYFK